MAQRKYLRDQRYGDRRKDFKKKIKSCAKIFSFIVIGLTLLVLAGYSLNRIQRHSSQKAYNEYLILCENGEYDTALKVYREIYEQTNRKSFLGLYDDLIKNTVLDIEDDIKSRMRVPFIDLIEKGIVFSDEDLRMMESFQEVSVRIITSQMDEMLIRLIYGDISPERTRLVYSEIRKIDLFLAPLFVYESQIDQIAAFSPEMNNIKILIQQEKYLEAAETILLKIDGKTGFVSLYLNGLLEEIKQLMYPQISEQIEELIYKQKFYTALNMLERTLVFFPDDSNLNRENELCLENTSRNLIEYISPVEHLAIRPLISDRNFRFDLDSYTRNAENLLLLTDEFERILRQLYQNNYLLIDIESLVTMEGKKSPLFIPEGKKPLILSIEGLNYYASRMRTGNSRQLLLDSSGNVASVYYDEKGNSVMDRNGEAIGILEQFIEKHPDFSFNGAKGNISLTGFEGVFGYLTDQDQIEDRIEAYKEHLSLDFEISLEEVEKQAIQAREVIEKLQSNGWTFSSSTYGNISVGETGMEIVEADTSKWIDQVALLTGPVKTILFPHGSVVKSSDPKGYYLIQKGFLIHCGIGPTAYFNWGEQHLFMDRIPLNGYSMRNLDLSRFFDVREVYSSKRIQPIQ
jgi:tetratricopeptide (TPR) repeat protein